MGTNGSNYNTWLHMISPTFNSTLSPKRPNKTQKKIKKKKNKKKNKKIVSQRGYNSDLIERDRERERDRRVRKFQREREEREREREAGIFIVVAGIVCDLGEKECGLCSIGSDIWIGAFG